MEYETPYMLLLTILVIAAVTYTVMHILSVYPKYPRYDEGFYGGVAKGSGHPDCLRTLSEAAAILDKVQAAKKQPAGLGDAQGDYAELELLLSKMACLKKDLMSPSGVPEATRYQAFETAHDRLPVAEVTGMCLSKTIPKRDLEIVFGTWRDRASLLLRKLCTEAQLSEAASKETETLFAAAWNDVYQVATSQCLASAPSAVDKGDVAPFDAPSNKTHRSYDFQYGGLSASGWNGSV